MNDDLKKLTRIFKNPIIWVLLVMFFPTIVKILKNPAGVISIIVIIIFLIYLKNKEKIMFKKDHIPEFDPTKSKKIVVFFLTTIVVLFILIKSVIVIPAGSTGVYHLFGKVKDNELRSGLHLVNPLANITKMSIRTEEYTMSIITGEGKKAGDDSIQALTKEGLKVDLDITVFYHLTEEKASDVFKELGEEYEEKIIRPEIRSAIREVVAKFEAKDIYSEKRQEAALKIQESLQNNIGVRGIGIESVLLRNITLPAKLAESIQSKLTAEQEVQRYNFVLETEKKEAERKIIEAEGQREAQRIINQSLSTNYLYYLYINQLKDREGTVYVPTSPSTGMPLFRDIGR